MTGRLERIEKAFEEFRSKIADCRHEATSDMADIRDAYERFYRLRERYEHEANERSLSPTEHAALRKVFEGDKFIESVGKVRGISEHVETGDVELFDTDYVSATITAKSSAAVVFAARTALLIDNSGQIYRLNHLKWLTEAENRIARAIAMTKRA
jgi:hypothetical protein